MLESLESGIGLDVVVWLQSHENALFDLLATILHITGENLFYIILLPLFYWSFDKTLGRRLLFGLIFSGLAVVVLKNLFQTPRPYIAFPDEVNALFEEDGYGIPSGHVTNSMVLVGIGALWAKKRWLTIAAVVYVMLMGWSRMYAGVHYPQDVLGGVVVAGILLWVLAFQHQKMIGIWNAIPIAGQFIVILTVAGVIAAVLWHDEDALVLAGVLLGAGIGNLVEQLRLKFTVPVILQKRLVRYVVGIALLMLVFFGLRVVLPEDEAFRIVRYGLVGLVALAGYPWLFIRTSL